MQTYDESTAKCHVFPCKEGLLSKLGHDLEVRVGSFQVDFDEDRMSVHARFDAASLKCVHALSEGRPNRGAISPEDIRKIDGLIVSDVLHSSRYPELNFDSTEVRSVGDGYLIRGVLTIHGNARPIEVSVRREGDRFVAETTVYQPDYGIKPFSAALGALRIQPDVRVRLEVPAGNL